MIAKKTQLLTIATCLLIQTGVQANDLPEGIEFQLVNPTPNPITIDGDLSDWVGAELLVDPEFHIPKGSGAGGTPVTFEPHNGGEWDGPDDFSSTFQALYDADNVYLAMVVTDEYHENGANSPWNGDSVQIHIANDDRDSQVGLYNFALGGTESDPNFFPVCGPDVGPCIAMEEAGPGGTDVAIVRDNSADVPTTTYEIVLTAESLGFVAGGLVANLSFGLGMAINDGDFDTPGQKGWGGLGPHSVVFGKSPEETAALFLGEEVNPPVPGDANGDGKVNAADLNILGGNWQMMVAGGIADGDFNEDGDVTAADLNILGGNWQFGAAPLNAAVPEPSGAVLVILGCFLTLVIRRRKK